MNLDAHWEFVKNHLWHHSLLITCDGRERLTGSPRHAKRVLAEAVSVSNLPTEPVTVPAKEARWWFRSVQPDGVEAVLINAQGEFVPEIEAKADYYGPARQEFKNLVGQEWDTTAQQDYLPTTEEWVTFNGRVSGDGDTPPRVKYRFRCNECGQTLDVRAEKIGMVLQQLFLSPNLSLTYTEGLANECGPYDPPFSVERLHKAMQRRFAREKVALTIDEEIVERFKPENARVTGDVSLVVLSAALGATR